MKFFSIILFVFSYASVCSQTNLVPNGSFELFNNCPKANSAIDSSSTNFPTLKNWFRPTMGTADFYHACNTFSNSVGVPNNEVGFQYAKDGDGYIGIFVYYNDGSSGFSDFREYVQVKLNQALTAGITYEVVFYIASNANRTVSNIGAYLSKEKLINYSTRTNLIVNPQINNTTPILDTSIWYKVSGTIVASGGEEWLTIGNFQSDAVSSVYSIATGQIDPNKAGYSYTLVDDVSLVVKSKNQVKFLCSATDSVKIAVKSPVNSFKWFDNNTTNSERYFKEERTVKIEYKLTDGTPFEEVYEIKNTPNIFNQLVFDTNFCDGTGITLNIKKGNASFLWSNGKTDSFFYANSVGKYWLKSSENGCVRVDTFELTNKPSPSILYYPDTFFCDKKSILIGNSNYPDRYSFLWNNKISTKQYLVKEESKNVLAIKDSFCWSYDTIEVIKKLLPNTGILSSYTICSDRFDTLQINANTFASNVWFPQNQSGSNISIYASGKYWHTAVNNWGCEKSDTFLVIDACLPVFYMPNAFTPNGDGLNDHLNYVGKYIATFNLKIFDRWGQLVYENNNFENKWNGESKNTPLPDGVYVYEVKYTSLASNVVYEKSGTITIIR